MPDDPEPWFRCRCVYRRILIPELAHLLSPADPYYDRCPGPPTGEDGLCDHCREPEHAAGCADAPTCCRMPGTTRTLAALDSPCLSRHP